jgi:hypothetical protein
LKAAGLGQRSECGHHGEREYASKRIFLSRHILVKEYTKLAFNRLPRADGWPQVLGSQRECRTLEEGRKQRSISIGKG